MNVLFVKAANDLTIMPIDLSEWGDSTLLQSGGEYLLIDAGYGKTTTILDFLINNNVNLHI